MISRNTILVIIVIAQFACVSLWFAGNGVIGDLIAEFNLPDTVLGHLTSAVQLGFIAGTLFFAVFAFADRFSPSLVFFFSSIAAALANLAMLFAFGDVIVMYGSRFITGFFLAGIYPVGMKIAADYFDKDLGKALGYLLGALVLGTAFPHLLNGMMDTLRWEDVFITISILSIGGGLLIFLLVPDGPYRKTGSRFSRLSAFNLFREKNFRSIAFSYFGHMWELYAFWTFVPLLLSTFVLINSTEVEVSQFSFLVIGVGSIGCIVGGYLARTMGSYNVAFIALALSGFCCLVSPLIFTLNAAFIYVFCLLWGMTVIMDSPQFSTLIAQTAPPENKGSSLTIVNCIGFSITIFSIQLLNFLSEYFLLQWMFIFLLPGPAFGLWSLLSYQRR